MINVELLIDERALLGEGPSWDSKKKLLYWVDVLGKKIHMYDPKKNINKTIKTEHYVSAVVPCKSGNLLLAMQHGFYKLNLDTKTFTKIADPESHIPGNRFNDGKCDELGRFWSGTMDLNEAKEQGALYCLSKDYTVKKVLDKVSISNGITWDKEKKIMYFIDSPTKKVVAFDFDLYTSEISNKRMVIQIPDGEGFPDGMTIDSEGMLWIAQWGGYEVSRWDPNKCIKLDSIRLPVAKVSSCVFGGEDLDELYITTARTGLSEKEQIEQPYAGSVFRLKTGIKGSITYEYDDKNL